MPKNSVLEWDATAANNTDIAGINIQGAAAVSNFDDALRTVMAQIKTYVSLDQRIPAGHINGLTLSNNGTDAVNDIDISTGEAASDGSVPYLIALTSSLTKRLDAAWAVGSGNGGLDTGTIANATYHIWLIQRSDTDVVDALFSLSATSPTMPTNYDRKRRIGSIVRAGATILAFSQNGDEFTYTTPVLDLSAVALATSASTLTLASVPTGLKFLAIIRAGVNNATNTSNALISSLDATDQAPALGVANIGGSAVGATAMQGYAELRVRTNTSSQIRARAGTAAVTLNASTVGWVDTRGR